MRRVAVLFFAVALLFTPSTADARQLVGVGPGGGQAEFPMILPPGRVPKTGTGRLRGRITAADTGAIVRRAQVRISGQDIGSKTAFTDAQGRYEFRDLPAGRFNLSVSKSGFVTMQYGQSRPFESGKQIELADAQVMEKADVSLPRGSAVSGRILDEFGEPVADASVNAMRLQYASGRRRLVPSGRASTTNDLGYFRVFGLPPGDYYLTATVRTLDSMVMDLIGGGAAGGPTGSNSNSGYAATYYPGTTNPAEAQRLSLVVGQEMQLDLQMQPVRLAKITGTAASSDGKPMSNAMVMLIPAMKDAVAMIPGGTSRTDKDGNFTISNVAPGDYTLQVQSLVALMNAATQVMSMMGGGDAKDPPPASKPMEREFAVASVTVAGEDISGLVVTGTRGARATGRVVFEGDQKPAEPITSLRLIAVPSDADNMGAGASAFGMASVKENGTFEIDGLAGGRLFQFMNPPKGWFLKRVTHDGEDITDRGHDFKPGEEVDGFEITMTQRTQRLTGRVTSESGDPVKEYTVVAFPEDQAKWTLPSNRWIASARPDQDGRFELRSLPAGKYLAVAVEYVAQGEWNDPEWLARAARNATRVTLDEGASATIDLKLLKS
ncbi:MAG TPA: carboxypeptidase-like regulatory domain-containing protein [Vicinamibacterales bacterium]|nr:carboxypeptidase-like regulatory domain-containing protein [Vicinamibacterales bacterium]